MNFLAASLVSITMICGHTVLPQSVAGVLSDDGSRFNCPTWFEDAPRIGPGRPEAVPLQGLDAVTICRYNENPNLANGPGLPPNNKLATGRMIDRRSYVRSIGRELNHLGPANLGGKPLPLCSNEAGGGFYLRFMSRDGSESSVEVIPSGCARAVAGKRGEALALSVHLRNRLLRLAPLPRP